MTTTDITVLKQLTAIRLDVAIWTARRKLTPADFGSSDLPPEKLASLGSKKVCNPEDLRIFATLKARAIAVLERTGVRFLGGWAIPEAKTAAVVRELTRIGQDFENARDLFLSRYDQAIRQWIADNPGWESLIAGSTVGVDTVRSRLSFGWQVFRVAPPHRTGRNGAAAASLEAEVGGLSQTLFTEVAKAASVAWRKTFTGKTEVSHKAVSSLKTIKEKLAGLAFVDPRVLPVADLVDHVLSGLPTRGRIAGEPLARLQGLVGLLREPTTLTDCGQRLLDGENPETLLEGLNPAEDRGPVSKETDPAGAPEDGEEFEDDTALPVEGPCLDSLGLW